MFQNANVLYKVHFSEGESKVDRQVIKQALRRKWLGLLLFWYLIYVL